MLFEGVGESCFLSKKVAKWYKTLKDFYKRRPTVKMKKRPSPLKNVLLLLLRGFR
jgi:hypothetical protein